MKKEKADPFAQAFVFTLLGGLWALVVQLFRGKVSFTISPEQLPFLLIIAVMVILGGVCVFAGFKHIEASEHTVLLTSSRIWAVLGAIVILGEGFTIKKLIGAGILVLGVLITTWKKQKFVFNKGAVFVLAAALFYALGETLSFYVLRFMDSVNFMIIVSCISAVMMLIVKPKIVKKLSFYFDNIKHFSNIIVVTIFDMFANLFVFLAYQKGRNAIQIGPIMSLQTIITVILALIFLKETDKLPKKIIGAITATIGTILLL